MDRLLRPAVCVFFACLTLACDKPPTSPTDDPPEAILQVIAGGEVSDTIGSIQPLAIQVTPPGSAPPAGWTVRFEALPGAGSAGVEVSEPGAHAFVPLLDTTTDQAGVASVETRLGTVPGTHLLRVSVPELAHTASLGFEVLPGQAVRLLGVADTSMTVGQTFQPSVSSYDRAGNPLAAPPSLSAPSGGLRIDDEGLVTADSTGFHQLITTAGALADTGVVTVFPGGVLALIGEDKRSVIQRGLADPQGDTIAVLPGDALRPRWLPDGETLLVQMTTDSGQRLVTVRPNGEVDRFVEDRMLSWEATPTTAPGVPWVYFAGSNLHDLSRDLWRVRLDGSNLERIPLGKEYRLLNGSVGPDGRIAAQASGGTELGVLDPAAETFTFLGANGLLPRWSPTGDLIAYRNVDNVHLVTPEGTERGMLGPVAFHGVHVWSPDGKWILIGSYGMIHGMRIIHVETGETMELPGTMHLQRAAWRR